MNDRLVNAILQKLAFKGDAMLRYQAAAVLTALSLHPMEIGADDIPACFRPQDSTTAGCSWALLKSDGVHLFVRKDRRASKSESRNKAWINTYSLTSVALAETWLRRHAIAPPKRDRDLFDMAVASEVAV
jgi:hypothetical protein